MNKYNYLFYRIYIFYIYIDIIDIICKLIFELCNVFSYLSKT